MRKNNDNLINLISLDINEGKYSHARKLLETSKLDNLEFIRLYGLLEIMEYNFDASLGYFKNYFNISKNQYMSLFQLTKVYLQIGEYDLVQSMLETLSLNSYNYVNAMADLIRLYILKKDYDKAFYLYQKLEKHDNFSQIQFKNLKGIYLYLSYLMNDNIICDNKFNLNDELYTVMVLLDKDDTVLIDHILKRHGNLDTKNSIGCFFEYLDYQKLLRNIRFKIEKMNANHYFLNDFYRIKLDEPIAFHNGTITDSVCVATVLGTKKIITMYPVTLSDKFDIEGNLYSKELKLKRKEGMKNA